MIRTSSKIRILLACCFLWAGLAVSCVPQSRQIPVYSREIATVGGQSLKEDELRFRLRLELDNYPKDWLEQHRDKPFTPDNPLKPLFDKILNKMIEDASILAYGKARDFELGAEELQARFEKKHGGLLPKDLENLLAANKIPYRRWKRLTEDQIRVDYVMEKSLGNKLTVSFSEIQAYYNKNRDDFRTRESARFRHIVTDTQEKAEEIRQRLEEGENFAQLAVNHSISPERARGGDLGYIEKGTYPEVFDKAFDLEKGTISPVLKSEYGYHIFKLLDKRPAGSKTLPEVVPEIQQRLFEEKLRAAYKTWIEEVRKAVPVQIHQENLKDFTV